VVKLLRTIGFLAVAAAVVWMVASEMIFRESRVSQVRLLLGAGVLLLVTSFLLSMVLRVSNKVTGSRCPRCGKPVQQGHIYCQDHLKEVVNRSRDDQRQKGDLG
jgi:predicted nucleic acid-binding Zn ribbon protein